MRRGLAVGVALLALTACGGESYDSTDEVMAAITDAGLPCENPLQEDAVYSEEQAVCTYTLDSMTLNDYGEMAPAEDRIEVDIYASDEQQDGAEMLRAEFAKGGFGGGGFFIVGDGWSVSLGDRDNAEALANALGGDLT